MQHLKMRLTGNEQARLAMVDFIKGRRGVTYVAEVAALAGGEPDPDSSSAGLNADTGPGLQRIEVDMEDEANREKLEAQVLQKGSSMDVVVEITDRW